MRPSRFLPFWIFCSLVCVSRVRAQSPAATKPRFQLDGEKWTYTSADRSFTGYLVKPAGNGPFPAVIINHGKGGRPDQFSLNWAREMTQWGLVCLAPTLTHVAGTDIQGKDGASAENIARVNDCLAILADLGYADMKRVAVTGHSMGAFLTIGFCGTVGNKIKAAAISAGGLAPREGFAAPPPELAAKITTPFLILHGTVDRAVAPAQSASLQKILDENKVPNRRELFVATDHDLPTNAATKSTVLALIREWFETQGVLPRGANTPPIVTAPADRTISATASPASLAFTLADRETPAANLTVTAASSNPKVLLAADIAIAGTTGQRTLTVQPLAGQSGPTTIFLTVSDGQLTTTRSFVLGFADASGHVPSPVIDRSPPPGRGRGGAVPSPKAKAP